MFWHTRTYKTSQSVALNSTTKYDIPSNVNIGSIWLKVVGQIDAGNPFAGIEKWRLIDYIDSVDIIANGSDVIKSLPATVLSALCFYDQGVFPPDQHREYSQPYMRNNILINFGRYFRDPHMYIPAGKYSSLELQIKFSGLDAGFQDGVIVDIIIEQPEGGGVPPSLGHMRTDVFRDYATTTGGIEYITLPKRELIRRIIFQAWPDVDGNYIEEGYCFDQIRELKFTLRSGTVEVYNGSLEHLAKMEAMNAGGPIEKHGHIYHTADKGFYSGLGYVYACLVGAGTKDGAVATVIPTVEADMNKGTQKMEAYSADEPVTYQVKGLMPDNCLNFRFDNLPDPSTWLNPQSEGDVDITLTTRTGATYADGKVKVCLDTLVPV